MYLEFSVKCLYKAGIFVFIFTNFKFTIVMILIVE